MPPTKVLDKDLALVAQAGLLEGNELAIVPLGDDMASVRALGDSQAVAVESSGRSDASVDILSPGRSKVEFYGLGKLPNRFTWRRCQFWAFKQPVN